MPASDQTLESAGVQLIHFPLQSGFTTDVPSLYQPWDLQHLHLPEFFTTEVIATREYWYRAFCKRAERVVVATNWAKRDLVERYDLDHHKIAVIPVPPPIDAYAELSQEDIERAKHRLSLPQDFIFYPAQTWRHKNHTRLLEALALIRDRSGVEVTLVCSGRQNDHYPALAKEVARLELGTQVRFTGYVSPDAIQALYLSARALIFPSLFEGWGLPIVEAFSLGVPVACARVTSLPELVGDAALLFDPRRPTDIADAIWQIWTDEPLRRTLVTRGRKRVENLHWGTTARAFRAHYRELAHQRLDSVDRDLLRAASGVAGDP